MLFTSPSLVPGEFDDYEETKWVKEICKDCEGMVWNLGNTFVIIGKYSFNNSTYIVL